MLPPLSTALFLGLVALPPFGHTLASAPLASIFWSQSEDDEEEKDYWEGIQFTEEDFAEVRRFVRLFYIDPSYDKRMAWIIAADFALHELTPPYEILPEEFYKRAKSNPKLRPRYSGKIVKLRKHDPFILHEVGNLDRDEKDFKGLSLSEVEQKKKALRERQQEIEKAFARIPFNEADFMRVVDFIRSKRSEKGPDDSRIFIAAARGYLASLDPHSTIISAKAWEEATKNTADQSFEGIGAVLTKRGDQTIIETPMEGQPAYNAGLRAGDIIIAVDGKSVEGMPLHKVVQRIRGPKGTKVRLTIRRLGEPKELEFEIVRDRIEVKNVQYKILDGHPDIGWLKISGFVEGTSQDVKAAIETLEKKTGDRGLRGLILDLRNNSGGLLQEAVEIADFFLDDGIIVSVKNPSDRDEVYKAEPGSYKFPVVVLVNSQSASAAEILASALQENKRALVVGERTFGKASVQTLLNPLLRRDYFIKITIARYYAPSGRTIQVTGVIPDVEIPPPPGEEPLPSFREEDLFHHLTRLSGEYSPLQPGLVAKVVSCERKHGTAEKVVRSDPRPRVKPDYALLKAADLLECLVATTGYKRDSDIPKAAEVQ